MMLQPLVHPIVIVIICGTLLAFAIWAFLKTPTRRTAWLRRIAVVICVAGLLVGISIPGGRSQAGMTNIDAVFVVDATTSMGARDYDGDKERMIGVREDITKIIESMPGARFTIISFDSEARTLLPLTTDRSSAISAAQTVARESSRYSKGSSIDTGLEATKKQLTDLKEHYPDRASMLFFLSDGEQTVDKKITSFAELRPYVSAGAVLGYGTEAGGKMTVSYGYDEDDDEYTQYVETALDLKTFETKVGVSKIDEQALKTIATELGVSYENRNSGGAIDTVIDSGNVKQVADNTREITFYINLYFVWALALTGLLLWELWYLLRANTAARRLRPLGKGGAS